MIKALMAILLMASMLGAQNKGEALPWLTMRMDNQTGVLLPGGKLCSYAAGTSTPLATYSDTALTSANANPMVLGSDGRPAASIYLDAVSYKFVLRTAGSDGTCSTGTIVWTRDNVYTLGALARTTFTSMEIDKKCIASARTGTTPNNAGGKIAACITALAATGGVVDASGLEGAQAITANMFASVTKPVRVMMGAATYTISATQTINTELISIEGLGPGVTNVTCTVNAACFDLTLSPFNVNKGAAVKGFTLNGNTGASAVGIRLAAYTGAHIENVVVQNFDNNIGIWFDNVAVSGTPRWTERTEVRDVWLANNRVNFQFSVNGGTNSFFNTYIDGCRINLTDVDNVAFLSEDNAVIYGSYILCAINKDYVGAGTKIFDIDGTSYWSNNTYQIFAEDTGGGTGTGLDCAAGDDFSGTGFIVMAGFTNTGTCIPSQLLTTLAGEATFGVVESPQTLSARNGTGFGTFVQPQMGASASFQTGVGFNLRFDGTNWVTKGDGSSNGGAGIYSAYGSSNLVFMAPPTTGGAAQSISNATMNSSHIAAVMAKNNTIFYGTNATDQILKTQVRGAANPQFYVTTEGDVQWGPSTGAHDNVLERFGEQRMKFTAGVAVLPSIGKPACDSSMRGTFWVVQGAPGVKDDVEVCAKDAANAYAWRTIY